MSSWLSKPCQWGRKLTSKCLLLLSTPRRIRRKCPFVRQIAKFTTDGVSLLFVFDTIIPLAVTTELWQVKPRSASPAEYVYFYGIDRFTSTTLIESMKTGPYICDRVGLDDNDIIYGSANFISCKIAGEMVAGAFILELWSFNKLI